MKLSKFPPLPLTQPKPRFFVETWASKKSLFRRKGKKGLWAIRWGPIAEEVSSGAIRLNGGPVHEEQQRRSKELRSQSSAPNFLHSE